MHFLQKEVEKQLLFLIIIKYLINKTKRDNLLKTESNVVIFLIAERFLDQHYLFYGDHLSQMCSYGACLSARQLSILKNYDKAMPTSYFLIRSSENFSIFTKIVKI